MNRELIALKDKVLAIVDIETTGCSASYDRIIEIGILRIEEGKVVKIFNKLINPQRSVSTTITSITGINLEDLLGAPTFEDISFEIKELLDGAIFVAHNARFDYGFIKNEFKRLGENFSAKCLCSVRLSRKLFPKYKSHDLTSIIERFNLSCKNRHRAFDDAKVIWDFFLHIEKLGKHNLFEKTSKEILKQHTFPQLLKEKTVDNLPEGPGVYTFFGPEGETLYIGKSRNIRHRVLSHFRADHLSQKEMSLCEQTVRIEAVETAGELGALLLESERVKKEHPLYNRVLRRKSELVIARKFIKDNYAQIILERVGEIEIEGYGNVMAIFKSLSQAKEFLKQSSLEYKLCPKLLGLEKGNTCFYYQLGKCNGACKDKEKPEEYNQRFDEAFKARRLKSWPFIGPILIEEKKSDLEKQGFILDNWCLLKTIVSNEDNTEGISYTPKFDYDSYKIFARYLTNPANRRNVKHLSRREFQAISANELERDFERVIE